MDGERAEYRRRGTSTNLKTSSFQRKRESMLSLQPVVISLGYEGLGPSLYAGTTGCYELLMRKLQHWRGLQAICASNAAPVLVFQFHAAPPFR